MKMDFFCMCEKLRFRLICASAMSDQFLPLLVYTICEAGGISKWKLKISDHFAQTGKLGKQLLYANIFCKIVFIRRQSLNFLVNVSFRGAAECLGALVKHWTGRVKYFSFFFLQTG